mgnify:CR=1 FL=1
MLLICINKNALNFIFTELDALYSMHTGQQHPSKP